MLIINFKLFVFILAASIIIITCLFHSAFAALLVIIVPEAFINHFAHAIMHVYSGARGRCQVKNGQYECQQFFHFNAKVLLKNALVLHNYGKKLQFIVINQAFYIYPELINTKHVLRLYIEIFNFAAHLFLLSFQQFLLPGL